jgi:hypothetical protein
MANAGIILLVITGLLVIAYRTLLIRSSERSINR